MLTKYQIQTFTSSEEFDDIVIGGIDKRIEKEVNMFRADGVTDRMWAVSALFDLRSDLHKKKRVDVDADS